MTTIAHNSQVLKALSNAITRIRQCDSSPESAAERVSIAREVIAIAREYEKYQPIAEFIKSLEDDIAAVSEK